MKSLAHLPSLVWILLVALTLAAFIVAETAGATHFRVVAILAITGLKAMLVLDRYMEVRLAAMHWNILYIGWISVVVLLFGVGFI